MSFNNQWIEIFKTGDYGDKGKYDRARLDEVVRNFDPANWQPVLTPATAQIGHSDTAPALGVVSAVKREGDRLLAQFDKVHPRLEESVRDGRFPNRSVGLYSSNKQGLVLRHVAFLGAMPPEVKGLAPVKFSDGEFVAIEFADSPKGEEEETVDLKEVQKTVRESIRDFFSPLFGERKAEGGPSTEELKTLMADAVKTAVEPLNAKMNTMAEENKTLREQIAAGSKQAAVSEVRTYTEGLKKAGKWVPALDGILPIIEAAAASGQKVKFTEGSGKDAKEVEMPALEAFKKFADSLGQIVPLGELAGGATGLHARYAGRNDLVNIDRAARVHAVQAEALKSGKKLSYAEAREAVMEAEALTGTPAASAGGMTSGLV